MHHHFIDRFAQGDSPLHRLDARAKLAMLLAYSVVLISFDRHVVAGLAPMAVLPLAMLWFARVPVGFALRRVVILSPLVLMLVLMSPLYDRVPYSAALGPWQFAVRGGWLTAADIAVKFALGVLALTAVMCSTPFSLLLEAMRRLAVPRIVVLQLGFLYRYLFLLMDEAMRVRRARDFRGAALAPVGRRMAATGGVIGALFVRTLDRSERVQLAMAARGYRGELHSLDRLHFAGRDVEFLLVAAAYLAACRWGF
jgi:cobalt/nickel transport system permease protein